MNILFLVLLGIFTAVHLYHSWTDERKKRAITKPFLLIFIALYYAASKNFTDLNIVLLVALATSWLGDVLLIPKGIKWFAAGGISFLVSHISFICVYIRNLRFENVKWYLVAPLACAYLAVVVWVFKTLIPHNDNKPLFIAMAFYIVANATMNIFAFMQMLSNVCPGTIIAYIGAAFFFVSDCSLFLTKFHPNRNFVFKRHFTVMLTYVIGEFLIARGLLLM